ncbi:TIM barrel protein [Pararhizobium sp. O133]|uniref:TIM barrel protein n=1 Tax=Pararhizobium sp. O133 TaxID=3449278 RepID=UPI003F683ACA
MHNMMGLQFDVSYGVRRLADHLDVASPKDHSNVRQLKGKTEVNIIAGVGFNTVSKDGHAESIVGDLKHYSDIGADYAELCMGTIDVLSGGKVIPGRLAALTAVTRQFPLKYSVHGLVSSNFMHSATLRHQIETVKGFLQVCDAVGSRVLVHHTGFVSPDRPADRAGADEREFDALAEVAEVAAKYDVRIMLENIFTVQAGEYRKSPTQVAQTVRTLNHPNIAGLIDFSHAYIECTYRGLDYLDELRAMAPIANHLHVHDSFGQPAGDMRFFYPQEASALGVGDIHLPIGWGNIAWDKIFSELTFLPGTILMMEISGRFRPEQAACLEMARKFADAVNRRALQTAAT